MKRAALRSSFGVASLAVALAASALAIRAGLAQAQGTPATASVAQRVRVSAKAGARPLRVQLRQASGVSRVRAVRADGQLAPEVRVSLGRALRGTRALVVDVRATALPGRYGLQWLTNGAWLAAPDELLALAVLDPKGGVTPIQGVLGLLGAPTGRGAPSAGALGAGAPSRQDVGASVGLSTSNPRAAALPARGAGAAATGDARLMTGSTDDTSQDDADADTDAEDAQTTTDSVTVDDTDTQSSDGSQTSTSTVTVSSSDGSYFAHTVTSTTDSAGHTTTTQHAILRDSSGNVTEEGSCTGHACTPNPEDGGCTSQKACAQLNAWLAILSPVSAAYHRDWLERRQHSLGGDAREPGATRAQGTRESLDEPAGRAVDPVPESDSSGGSSGPAAPSTGRTIRRDLKGTLPDPIEPGTGGTKPVQADPRRASPPRQPAPVPR